MPSRPGNRGALRSRPAPGHNAWRAAATPGPAVVPQAMNGTCQILCVLNPDAGGGIAARRWPEVAALLDAFGMRHDLLAEADPEAQVVRRLDREGPQRYAAIAGIGGDGTHAAVINGLMRFRAGRPATDPPPYALIPMGTGNDLAKSFGLTAREDFFVSDLRRAVAAIRYGADYRLDLGRFGDRYFADALTIGLDSAILRERNRRRQDLARRPLARRCLRGYPLYALCAGQRLWRQRPFAARIAVDGAPWYDGSLFNLVINNTRVYGGEFVVCPDAYASDGLLDVAVFSGPSDYLARYLLALRAHPSGVRRLAERLRRSVAVARGAHIAVRLSQPEPLQCDGEELPGRDAVDVSVVPGALRLKIPVEPD